MAISKRLLDLVKNLPNEIIPAHDWLLNEAASYNDGMYCLEKILTHYRQHEANSVGIVNSSSKQSLLKSRRHTLDFFDKTHKAIIYIHQDKEVQEWAKQLLRIDNKRKRNLKSKSILGCLETYISNHKNMTKRCFIGDIYTIVKLK